LVAIPDDDVTDQFYVALMTGIDCLELADLLDEPDWQADSLCREHPEVDFFPRRGGPNALGVTRVRPGCRPFARPDPVAAEETS
jgi:hypothetical protein